MSIPLEYGRIGQGMAPRLRVHDEQAVTKAMRQILDMGTTKAARAIGLTVGAVDWHLRLGKPDALRSLAVRMLDRNTA